MKKMKTIPFDLTMAKEIHEGKREGEIVTREGNPVEILTFDADLRHWRDTQPADIIYIIKDLANTFRIPHVAYKDGKVFRKSDAPQDLLLRVPDDMQTDNSMFKPFYKVLVRDNIYDLWRCEFFSHMPADNMYACISGIYTRCIPYEGNEELVGTSNEPKTE